MSGVDYKQQAGNYAKYRRVHPEVLRSLLLNSGITGESRVLEVGCGTGNYIIELQARTGCRAFGVEPSEEMLRVARSRSKAVEFRNCGAEDIAPVGVPLDFIFTVDVIHFVQDRLEYFRRAIDMLREGGRICTVTDNHDVIRMRKPLSNYFPETLKVEFQRYPKDGEIRGIMDGLGFAEISEQRVFFEMEITDIGLWKNKASSSLNLIPEEAFRRGITRMEADLKNGPIKWVSPYLLIWGKK